MVAFLKLFDIIPGWVWAILLGLAGLAWLAEHNNYRDAVLDMAQLKQQVAEKETQRATVAMEATNLRAEITAVRAGRSQEINDAIHEERRMSRAAAAAAQPARDQLRNDTVTFTVPRSGAGGGDPQALQRAEETARAYGSLLVTCDRVAEGLATDAEDLAGQVRALIASYESLSLRPGPSALDPFPDRQQVDPSARLRWHSVVHPALPDLAVNARVDLRLRLGGVDAQVLGEGNPPAHHPLSDPR